jgi:hypothetical protein
MQTSPPGDIAFIEYLRDDVGSQTRDEQLSISRDYNDRAVRRVIRQNTLQ